MQSRHRVSINPWRTTATVLLALGLTLAACGPKEQPAPSSETGQAITKKTVSPAIQALHAMPEQATAGFVVLSPNRLAAKAKSAVRRFTPDDAAADALINEAIVSLSDNLGFPEVASLEELIAATGMNGDAPLTIFCDMTQRQPATPSTTAAPQPLEQTAGAPDGSTGEDTGQTVEPPTPIVSIEPEGAFAVVFECSDTAKARAFLEQGRGPGRDTSEESGVTIVHHSDLARYYAADGARFIIGNASDIVKAALAPSVKPITVRYATPDCPADPADEVVALIRADKALPSLFGVSQLMTGAPPETDSPPNPGATGLAEAYKGDDPLVFTLALDDTKLELLARIDGETHPGMRAIKGALAPLTQAQLFPQQMQALLSFGFTPERKKSLQDAWAGAVPPETQKNPTVAQALGTAQLVFASIGNQVTLGIEPSGSALPRITAAIDLVNAPQTKALLQTLGLPLEQKELYADVEILAAPIPLPLDPPQSIHLAFVQNTVLLGNDLAALKTVLDHTQNGSASSLFSSQQPPLDPSQPREALLLLKGAALSEILKPLLGLQGALDPSMSASLDKAAQNVQELRYDKTLAGTWYEDRLALRFNPEPPHAPAPQ